MPPPKKGKDTLLDLCATTINLGNNTAVHILEYLSDAKQPRHGFRELAIGFLDSSHALFSAKAGLAETERNRAQLPPEVIGDLRELLRTYNTNFSVLNQMVNKILENEHKQGFSKWGAGFRMMFTDTEIEKMRASLIHCREAARKNTLLYTWSLREYKAEIGACIGYTALAAVLERADPTKGKAVPPAASSPVAPVSPEPLIADSHLPQLNTGDHPQRLYGASRTLPRDLPSPAWSDSPRDGRESAIDPALSANSSKGTMQSQTFSSRITNVSDYFSEITPPASMTNAEEQVDNLSLEDNLPKTAVRVKTDPAAAPRWRPKHGTGAITAGSKTALLVAVQEGNHKMVEHLLDCGVPPDYGPECNLLRVALMNHDLDSVRLLLLFGADANASDKDKFTPLYAATEASFYEAAQFLLKYGADPNTSAGPEQENPFALAVRDGKGYFAQLYLKHGADPGTIMGSGDTPFMQTMNKLTAKELVQLMLIYDADVNQKNSHGETALFKAINAERLDLVALLLDHSANPNLPGPKHMLWPAVHRPAILERLLKSGADLKKAPGVLELATSINSLEAVKILLKYNVDPNAKKDGIFTPLCTAIRDNRENLVEILIKAGSDPNLPASEYPAFKCVTHHRAHILPRILAAGADPNTPTGIIETCVQHNNQDALMLLLKHGVDPNARNAAGHTALTTAIRKNDLSFIDILITHGADPGVRGEEWPINMAVKHPEILARLLPHISPPKIPKGALELSVQADALESVKLLLAKGVDVEEKNGGVFSPLTTSIREDRKEIFQYLLDDAGADPNLPGEHLPIIKAIRRHREHDLSYIKHLLQKGADINLMYRGWNAVLQALDKGDMETLRLLAEVATPDLNARDEDGNSVLDIMHERGMTEEEKILLCGGRNSSPKAKEANRQLREYVRQ